MYSAAIVVFFFKLVSLQFTVPLFCSRFTLVHVAQHRFRLLVTYAFFVFFLQSVIIHQQIFFSDILHIFFVHICIWMQFSSVILTYIYGLLFVTLHIYCSRFIFFFGLKGFRKDGVNGLRILVCLLPLLLLKIQVTYHSTHSRDLVFVTMIIILIHVLYINKWLIQDSCITLCTYLLLNTLHYLCEIYC